ncbi:MAG: protein phosphatase 2C domain-containing protein [Cyanosarcina radialis HA8281-LM2]|jgi:serine/threonine protein phosphatase PrpC|nr:protein phosphatase 2C domain-containing protein [Cyanosarcina radialis HA8281-LM2]
MKNSAANITCPNPTCQAPNPLSHNFCQKCRTPLPKVYLWALGNGIDAYPVGKSIADRYLVKERRIWLDTKPGVPPQTTETIPEAIAPYLKLSPYQPHTPQIYGLLNAGEAGEIWLLEQVPIYSGGAGAVVEGQLMPNFVSAWQQAPAVRQLNWLLQMAALWQPLSLQGVASSLLDPELVRVEGSLVRLLQYIPDETTPTMSQLGQLWSQLLPLTNPPISDFLQKLCQQLMQGEDKPDWLVEQIDRALGECARSQSYSYQIVTESDRGPSRQRNEDACYPPGGGAVINTNGNGIALSIVCDGIGGHEGGNVASNMAIHTIAERINNLLLQPEPWQARNVSGLLESYVRDANDSISQRNDSEQRRDRQRMGTTVVMAVGHAHEVYLTHVGDSRVYRISRTGCHQVTLDDDLASREVRLGYAIYREAIQYPTSGSLVQALGMGASNNLHPTVQRFAIDEDCIFLLCSDGLSDRDRVEQYWETEILPVLEGKRDLATTAKQLIRLGNTLNGHDNVTVGLVYCQAQLPQSTEPMQISVAAPVPSNATIIQPAPTQAKTQQPLAPPTRRRSSGRSWLLWAIPLFLILGVGSAAVLAIFKLPPFGSPTATSNSPGTQDAPFNPDAWEKGWLLKMKIPVVGSSIWRVVTPVDSQGQIELELCSISYPDRSNSEKLDSLENWGKSISKAVVESPPALRIPKDKLQGVIDREYEPHPAKNGECSPTASSSKKTPAVPTGRVTSPSPLLPPRSPQ